MSQKKLNEIEDYDYLLGRIAALERIVNEYGEGDRTKLQGWRAMLAEDRVTLKKVREIMK